MYVFASDLVVLFLKDAPEATSIGADFLRILAFSLGFMGVQFALTGIFRAAGNMNLTLGLGVISMFVLQFPLAYVFSHYQLFGFGGSLEYLWWAFPITNVVMAGICMGVYAKGDWKKKKLIEQ